MKKVKRMKRKDNSVEFNNVRRILKIYLLIFVCICEGLNVHMNTRSMWLERPEEGVGSLRTIVTDYCEPSCGFWKLNMSHMYEPSLHPQRRVFISYASFSLFFNLICLKKWQIFKQKGLDPYWNHSLLELSVPVSTLEIIVFGMINVLRLWMQCKLQRNYGKLTLLLFLFYGEKNRESYKFSYSNVIFFINEKDGKRYNFNSCLTLPNTFVSQSFIVWVFTFEKIKSLQFNMSMSKLILRVVFSGGSLEENDWFLTQSS